jgi:feruloyl esterase
MTAGLLETLGVQTVDTFVRVYIVPGRDGGGGKPASRADWFAILEQGIERWIARAEGLVLSQTEPVARTLPTCRYPNWPAYQGGDPNDARSYLCPPVRGFLRER